MICDLPSLFPQRLLPKDYFIVGPLVYNESGITFTTPASIDPGRKALFVNLGSTGNWSSMAFLTEPYFQKYNIATASDFEKVLGSVACVNFPFVAAASILPFADLVICHGGNGIVNQCLQYGLTMLCRTSHLEQEWNVDAHERSGQRCSIDGITNRRRLRAIVDEWISWR